MARYTIDVYDSNDALVATLHDISAPEYRRRKNQATGFSFGVLADDSRISMLQAARHCILYRDGVEKAAGYVTARDLTSDPYRFECITNEALLRRIVTPHTWKRWNGIDLAAAVRDAILDFKVQVRNTAADWAAAIDSLQVDVATLPGKVVLAKDVNGAYYSQGYITLQFDFGTITRYELLRWAEEVGEAVRIRAEYRISPDGTNWGVWSGEIGSVFPAEDGVILTGNYRYVQAKLHLYTDDTTTKDPNGVPTGFTPVLGGVEVIARVPGPVTEGDIPASTGITLQGHTFDRENALRILQTWCEESNYEFAVNGVKQLSFAQTLGSVKNVVLRRTGTMNIQQLQDNADQLENVILCLGAGEGPAQLQTTLRDQASIEAYDEHPGVFEDTTADTIEKLTAAGNNYLSEHAWPKEEFQVTNVPVEELEDFGCHDTVTIVDLLRDLVTTARVLDEERKLDTAGEEVTLGLNTTLDNVIEKLVRAKKLPADGLAPASPSGLTLVPGYREIELRWSRSNGADFYVVEHSVDGVVYELLETRRVGQRYRHAGLILGSRHWYKVYAVAGNRQSVAAGPVNAYAKDDTAPGAPTGLTVQTGPGKVVRLSWTPPADVDVVEYEIWRKDGNFPDNPAGAVKIAEEAGTVHLDTTGVSGNIYTWYVKAVDQSENVSGFSDGVSAQVPQTSPDQSVPTSFAGIGMAFEQGGADELYQDAQGSWLVRTTISLTGIPVDTSRAYVQVKHKQSSSTEYSLDDQIVIASGSVQVTVDDLLPGVAYVFAAVPVSHFGVAGTGKTGDHTAGIDDVAPATPANFVMSGVSEGIEIVFDPPGDADLKYVEVHLSTQNGFTPTTPPNDPSSWNGTTNTLFDKLSGPTCVATYEFVAGLAIYGRLIPVDTSGNRGTATTQQSATSQYASLDTTPPGAPTLSAPVATIEDLAGGLFDVRVAVGFAAGTNAARHVFERRLSPAGAWQEVGAAKTTPFEDRGGLKSGQSYDYRARGESVAGVLSSSYSNTVTAAIDAAATKPSNVTGLAVDFTGPDAVATWTPVANATGYWVKILSATDILKRTVEITDTSFRYLLADNVVDFSGNGSPSIKVSVEAKNAFGNYSATATVVAAVNQAPAQPTVQVSSSLTQIRWEITSALPDDWSSTHVVLGTYSLTAKVSSGVIDLATAGIADGANAQVSVYLIDVFGQNSDTTVAQTEARYLTREDMAGGLFNIQPSSSPAPQSGTLEQLWDLDVNTGPVFASAPTITFEYPMMWHFDMVRLYPVFTGSVSYYVQVYSEASATWVNVAGSAGSPIAATSGAWNIRRFDGNKMYAARELRIIFTAALTLKELKFWTSVLADEVLAQILTLTGSMKIQSSDGKTYLDSSKIRTEDVSGNYSELTAGRMTFFKTGVGQASYYVNAVLRGQVLDKTRVKFAGTQFSGNPKIMLSPGTFLAYSRKIADLAIDGKVIIKAYPENIVLSGADPGFDARCLMYVSGSSFVYVQNTSWYSGSPTLYYTPPNVSGQNGVKITCTVDYIGSHGSSEYIAWQAWVRPLDASGNEVESWIDVGYVTSYKRSLPWSVTWEKALDPNLGAGRYKLKVAVVERNGDDVWKINAAYGYADAYYNIDGIEIKPINDASGFEVNYIVLDGGEAGI